MRIDPLNILLHQEHKTNIKFYLISGNESTLIQKINSEIISIYKKNENASLVSIDSLNEFIEEESLFGNKKIYSVKSCKGINEKIINSLRNLNGIFLFVQENSQKLKQTKNIFINDEECCLIDCYEISRDSKIKILNSFLKKTNLILEKNIYWLVVERLDNRYVFLENTLKKIFELSQKNINLLNINKLLTLDNSGKDRIFFDLLKNNKEIINTYRKKIVSNTDVNEFYYHCKFFCQLIIDCKDEKEYQKKIPIYLFREKQFLIDVYRRYNFEKRRLLLKLLSSTEGVIRKNADLSLAFGLRFLLSLKRITIS
tara:strand:+ start:383 stop:1321 length:939 start_codon:yes stop_codon:yes gene_type:complete